MKNIGSNHFKKVAAIAILFLSCTTLYIASLNIKTTPSPLGVNLRRFWNDYFPADSVSPPNIQRGEINISVIDTYFENAFIKYDKTVTQGANNTAVKDAKFHNMSIMDIPTLVFQTEIESMGGGVLVAYEFYLSEPVEVTQNTVAVIIEESTGYADFALIQLGGSDINGTYKNLYLVSLFRQEEYFVNPVRLQERKELKDFITIDKFIVHYYCKPYSYLNVTTHIRVLNIFDDIPTLDGKPLYWGQKYIYLKDSAFPHKIKWNFLNPLKIFLVSTLQELNETWQSSFHSIEYTWLVQNPEIAQRKAANAMIWMDPSWDAPITSAKIIAQENEINFLENIQPPSNASKYITITKAIPTEGEEAKISIIFDYWPSPWWEIALVSCAIIIGDILFFTHKRIVRGLSKYLVKKSSL